ncbi:MAG: hypothetical protein ABIP94_05885, partial [Planctomycetota bacterium]
MLRRDRVRDGTLGLGLVLFFGCLHGLLRQASLHGQDVYFILRDVTSGHSDIGRHILFMPLA